MVKAAREAKAHTSWHDPHFAHEAAVTAFVDACLRGGRANPFIRDLDEFQRRTAYFGAINSLAQTLLKITSPGVPDFYQGTETWDFSLVDPDNRRPVDFPARRKMLRSVSGPSTAIRAGRLFSNWRDGRVKAYLIQRSLEFRRSRGNVFENRRYVPLRATGPLANNVVAFGRVHRDAWVITVVPRLLATLADEAHPPLGDFWDGTMLKLPSAAPRTLTGVLTSQELDASRQSLAVSDCLRFLPVGLLSGRRD